eukprot:866114-Prymnesium_polylepis.1
MSVHSQASGASGPDFGFGFRSARSRPVPVGVAAYDRGSSGAGAEARAAAQAALSHVSSQRLSTRFPPAQTARPE